MRPPLWLDVNLGDTRGSNVDVTVSLARCRNCGKVKVTSNPCSLDHLAALMEFGNRSESDAEGRGIGDPGEES